MKNSSNVAISLSKALKLKNRLAGRLAKTNTTISTYNSTVKGRANEVDVAAMDKQRSELVSALIALKTAIYDGNKGIYRQIIEITEKKGEIELLNSLNTRHGTEPVTYGEGNVTYVAVIKKVDVDARVKKLEKEIDDLQDDIDKYNADSERIRIPAIIMELSS